jgi:Spy/CpxP family protein refolding chaperone
MKKWQQFITGTLAVALLGAGSAAVAVPGGHGATGKAYHQAEHAGKRGEHYKHRHQFQDRLANRLNLTEEQRQAWQEERARLQADNRPDYREIREAHKALREARQNNASELEIAALHDNLKQLRIEHRTVMQEQRERFVAILTPEQREQLAELKAEHKAERKHRHKGGEKHRKWQDRERRGGDGARRQGKSSGRMAS